MGRMEWRPARCLSPPMLDRWTRGAVEAASFATVALNAQPIAANFRALRSGAVLTAPALQALSWQSLAAEGVGEAMLCTYFASRREWAAVRVQVVGVLATEVLVLQSRLADVMPWAAFVSCAVVLQAGLASALWHGLQERGQCPDFVLRSIHKATVAIAFGGVSFWVTFCACSGLWHDAATAIACSIAGGGVLLCCALQVVRPSSLMGVAPLVGGWMSTLLLMLVPLMQLVRILAVPGAAAACPPSAAYWITVRDGLRLPRALFIKDAVWFTGAAWGVGVPGCLTVLALCARGMVTPLSLAGYGAALASACCFVAWVNGRAHNERCIGQLAFLCQRGPAAHTEDPGAGLAEAAEAGGANEPRAIPRLGLSRRQYDFVTCVAVDVSIVFFILLEVPKILANMWRLFGGQAGTLANYYWHGHLLSGLGNALMSTYFASLGEWSYVRVQAIGIWMNYCVFLEVVVSGFVPSGIFVIFTILMVLGLVMPLVKAIDVWPWAFAKWHESNVMIGSGAVLLTLSYFVCDRVDSTWPWTHTLSYLCGAGGALIAGAVLYFLPQSQMSGVPTISAWMATLLFVMLPFPGQVDFSRDPTNKNEFLYSACLGALGNGLCAARALYIKNRVWFIGTVWGTWVGGLAMYISAFMCGVVGLGHFLLFLVPLTVYFAALFHFNGLAHDQTVREQLAFLFFAQPNAPRTDGTRDIQMRRLTESTAVPSEDSSSMRSLSL